MNRVLRFIQLITVVSMAAAGVILLYQQAKSENVTILSVVSDIVGSVLPGVGRVLLWLGLLALAGAIAWRVWTKRRPLRAQRAAEKLLHATSAFKQIAFNRRAELALSSPEYRSFCKALKACARFTVAGGFLAETDAKPVVALRNADKALDHLLPPSDFLHKVWFDLGRSISYSIEEPQMYKPSLLSFRETRERLRDLNLRNQLESVAKAWAEGWGNFHGRLRQNALLDHQGHVHPRFVHDLGRVVVRPLVRQIEQRFPDSEFAAIASLRLNWRRVSAVIHAYHDPARVFPCSEGVIPVERAVEDDPFSFVFRDLGRVIGSEPWCTTCFLLRNDPKPSRERQVAALQQIVGLLQASTTHDDSMCTATPTVTEQGLQRHDLLILSGPDGLEVKSVDEAAAEQAIRLGIQAVDDEALALSRQADEARRSGRYEAAVELYREALRIQPDIFETFNNLGLALVDGGRVDEAIDAYRSALLLKIEHIDTSAAHVNLANAIKRKGVSEATIAVYRDVAGQLPDGAVSRCVLGHLLEEASMYEAAKAEFEAALRLTSAGEWGEFAREGLISTLRKLNDSGIGIQPEQEVTRCSFCAREIDEVAYFSGDWLRKCGRCRKLACRACSGSGIECPGCGVAYV